jgi:uncharacterized membrane protein YfhO
VDGQEAPIYRANGLFRAVPLRPGQHVVELRYEPGAVRLGLGITLAALATALLSLIALFVKRRLSFRTA